MKIRLNKRIVSYIGAMLIKCLGSTWRVRFRGTENLEKARELSASVIFVFWHSRLAVLSWTHRNSGVYVLASENYDGDLMGRIVERFGFGHLKGSTSKGGARAIRQLKGVLSGGSDIGMAVDGPRGPRGVVQQGAVEISRMTGCAILPVVSSASRRKLFGSWDRFQVPCLFSRVTVAYGKPLVVDSGADRTERERSRTEIQDQLNGITTELDIEEGHSGPGVWPHEDN